MGVTVRASPTPGVIASEAKQSPKAGDTREITCPHQPWASPPSRNDNGTVRLRANPANRQVFDLQIIVDTVFGAFAAQSGLLDAAERGLGGGDDAFVDTDHAVFQRLGDAEDA